jgi:hypothetical protein
MLAKNVKVITVVAVAGLALAQTAAAREFAEIYTDCGLGALIAPRTPAVAAVTNVTFDLGTTAIISNISSPETCQGGQASTASFINHAYEAIETDLARGNGKYLDSLTTLAGVSADRKDAFVQALRNDFASQVSGNGYAAITRFQKAEGLYNLVYRHNS